MGIKPVLVWEPFHREDKVWEFDEIPLRWFIVARLADALAPVLRMTLSSWLFSFALRRMEPLGDFIQVDTEHVADE